MFFKKEDKKKKVEKAYLRGRSSWFDHIKDNPYKYEDQELFQAWKNGYLDNLNLQEIDNRSRFYNYKPPASSGQIV